MQTQCPHCKSRYRIGQEMIDEFGGFVRCGNCQYKFNVHDQVSNVEPLLDSTLDEGEQADLLDPNERVEPMLDSVVETEEDNIRFQRAGLVNEGDEGHNLDDFGLKQHDWDSHSTEEEAEEPDQLERFYEEQPSAAFDEQHSSGMFSSVNDSSLLEESSVISLINEDAREEEASVFQRLFHSFKRLLSFFFWGLIAVALAYFLFGQIKDKLYPAYKSNPTVQKIRAGFCQYVPCGASLKDLSQYEISFSRMDEIKEGTRKLRIKLFILNKAAHEQLYPNIMVRLTKLDGTTVGQRVLSPLDYLPSDSASVISGARFIKPSKLAQVVIVFDTPPEAAVGFEVRLVQ